MTFAKQIFSSFRKYKPTAFLIFAVLFLFAFNAAAISAQDKKPFKLKEAISKIKENSAEENGQKLVKEICERGVDFALTAENEKSLREAGANDSIIKVIREEIENHKERKRLYVIYNDNYDSQDIKNRKKAVEAGKNYLKQFENGECSKDDPLIPYFKQNLPVLEEQIKNEEKPEPPHGDPGPDRNPKVVIFTKAIKAKK